MRPVDTTIGSPYAEDPDSAEYREELAYAVDSFNRVVEGIDGIHASLHLRGKRVVGPERRRGYDSLLPALQELNVDMTMFELHDMDEYDRESLRRLPKRMQVGCGCLTAKQHGVETPEEVAGHVRKGLEVVESPSAWSCTRTAASRPAPTGTSPSTTCTTSCAPRYWRPTCSARRWADSTGAASAVGSVGSVAVCKQHWLTW